MKTLLESLKFHLIIFTGAAPNRNALWVAVCVLGLSVAHDSTHVQYGNKITTVFHASRIGCTTSG